jgi:hypothetical protein
MLSELVWIKTFPDTETAHRAQERLDAGGIHSVAAEDYAGAGPVLQFSCGVRLGVREDDAEYARMILGDGDDG